MSKRYKYVYRVNYFFKEKSGNSGDGNLEVTKTTTIEKDYEKTCEWLEKKYGYKLARITNWKLLYKLRY